MFVKNPGFLVFFENRAVGVNAPNFDVGVLGFEVAGRARNRPPRSDSNHQVRHTAFGLFPDFWTGLFKMSLPIRQIIVLVGLP